MSFSNAFQLAALGLFLAVVVGHTIHLRIKEGINPITLRLKGKGVVGVLELCLFLCVNLWALAVLWYALPFNHCPVAWLCGVYWVDGPVARGIGLGMIAVGLVIFVVAQATLGDSWRLGIDERHPGALVTRGIYRFSRHPLYLFFDLYFLGTFLLNGTAMFGIFAILVAANLHHQAIQEERFLLRVHGEAYRAYQRCTGRYLTLRLTRRTFREVITGLPEGHTEGE
ncbi:MAG: isoprenylcysteine carboxylmethyltransferase family protein [Chloroflexi bacterium]|nr:isoprenylcysteine carboxylmethyltransferase family protein [Chloroflexota bacterium]